MTIKWIKTLHAFSQLIAMWGLFSIVFLGIFLHSEACPSPCQCENGRYYCNLSGELPLDSLLTAVSSIYPASQPADLHIDMCKPVRTLRRLPSLRVVKLAITRCWIDSIEPGAFTPVKDTLKDLDLSYNGIDNLNWGVHQLEILRTLNMKHNQASNLNHVLWLATTILP
jgi:hypothetical protein